MSRENRDLALVILKTTVVVAVVCAGILVIGYHKSINWTEIGWAIGAMVLTWVLIGLLAFTFSSLISRRE